jgi:hypothetical protein
MLLLGHKCRKVHFKPGQMRLSGKAEDGLI